MIYRIFFIAGVVIILGLVYFSIERFTEIEQHASEIVPLDESYQDETEGEGVAHNADNIPDRAVLLDSLEVPWDIVFLSERKLLISEREGIVVFFDMDTGEQRDMRIDGVSDRGEGGLLGMIAHPRFEENGFIYMYLTSTLRDDPNASVNEVARYVYAGDTFTERKLIIGNIPGSLYHNGGRIAFGPDGYLYITTGDARMPDGAQSLSSLAGKILRITDEGVIPEDNPFKTAVYAYGSRNAQGLAWDEEGKLWSTEHGRTSLTQTGMDEINLIVPGGNYGWPESEGDRVVVGTIGPVRHSGARETWAPGSALFYNDSLFFGGLRSETLYEAVLAGTDVAELREHFTGEYGRIRTVTLGPDGMMYLLTSNRDGRGDSSFDLLIRLNPRQFFR